jgi:hypothetical protein
MPSVDLTQAESLLLVLVGQEEARLHQQIVELQRELLANRAAAHRSVLLAHGEDPSGGNFKVIADDKGRPTKLEWERA